MTRAVLFDLDGTFADTAPDLGAALNHLCRLHGRAEQSLKNIRLQASQGSPGLLRIGFGITPDAPEFPALRQSFLDYYASHICVHTRLFPDMAQLIEALEQRGLPWGIVTNKPHRFTVPLMQALGYAERAACLVSGDTCARAKPHPDPLFKAAEMLGIAPEHSLFLGDDIRDIQAGRAAGTKNLIARYGYIAAEEDLAAWQADGVIDTPMELIAQLAL